MTTADVIIANRAYRDHAVPPGEEEPADTGRGGLLVAVSPAVVTGAGGTTWVGAGRGTHDRAYVDGRGDEMLATGSGLLRHRRVFFDDVSWERFYGTVANAFLWPLLHQVRVPLAERTGYVPRPVNLDEAAGAWQAFEDANRAYAGATVDAGRGESAWVHDYHLGLVPAYLREAGYRGQIGFFLHTPVPDLAIARRVASGQGFERLLDWVRGTLGADLVGLQSPADVARFAALADVAGARQGDGESVAFEGRTVRLGAYPVGIDADEVARVARTAPGYGMLRSLKSEAPVVAGLERQDYTKGIPERLQAMAALWSAGHRFHYIGLASPTRGGVPGYERFNAAIEASLRMATAAAERVGCTCIQEAAALQWEEVVAVLRDADIVCTSSIADGMNLVPLQAAIAQSVKLPGERGVITMGRDTGAASAYAGFEDDGLVTIDPFDTAGFSRALAAAIGGKTPAVSDRLAAAVGRHDARSWGSRFLGDMTEGRP